MKYLFIFLFGIILAGCSSSSTVVMSNNTFIFGKKNTPIEINFTNPIKSYQTSFCTDSSSTIFDDNDLYGYIFIEKIKVSNLCTWNGLPSSFFETSIKQSLKLDSIKTVEKFDIDGYNFKTLKINDDSYLSLIYIYYGTEDILIYDLEGKLYTKLLKSFKSDYESNYLDKKRFNKKYSESLVKKTFIHNYFDEIELEKY